MNQPGNCLQVGMVSRQREGDMAGYRKVGGRSQPGDRQNNGNNR